MLDTSVTNAYTTDCIYQFEYNNSESANSACNGHTIQPNLWTDWTILTMIDNAICSYLDHTQSGY